MFLKKIKKAIERRRRMRAAEKFPICMPAESFLNVQGYNSFQSNGKCASCQKSCYGPVPDKSCPLGSLISKWRLAYEKPTPKAIRNVLKQVFFRNLKEHEIPETTLSPEHLIRLLEREAAAFFEAAQLLSYVLPQKEPSSLKKTLNTLPIHELPSSCFKCILSQPLCKPDGKKGVTG
ncbi:MAG: hypothetical protein FWG29_01855 [Treponema sp.]|nr:hypothetical protein [Treponema sp.]